MEKHIVDLGALGVDSGGHVLLKHALRKVNPGERLAVSGGDAGLITQLRAWCRAQGHTFEASPPETSLNWAVGTVVISQPTRLQIEQLQALALVISAVTSKRTAPQ